LHFCLVKCMGEITTRGAMPMCNGSIIS
jgi:hypothetical protein